MNCIKLLACTLCFISSLATGQKKADLKTEPFDLAGIENSVVEIKDNLYACKYEVSNGQYLQFIEFLRISKEFGSIHTAMPDTLNWRDKQTLNELFVARYLRHPDYKNFPVVNINYDAALLFCRKLTDTYNAWPKRKFKKVIFRLPDEEEWERAAQGRKFGADYPWGNKLYENNQLMCNFLQIGDENIVFDTLSRKLIIKNAGDLSNPGTSKQKPPSVMPVDAFSPNGSGLYNVCGNVAEMIVIKGISKGGGWRSPGGDVKVKSRGYYSKSAADLGFRCFMEILEK